MTTNQADDLTAETPKPRQVEERLQKTAAKAKPKTTAKAGKTAAQSQPKGAAKKPQGTTRPNSKASSQAKAATSSAAGAKPTARTSSRGAVKGARDGVKEVSPDGAESPATSQNLASKPSRKSVRKPEPKPTVQATEPSTAFSSAKPVDRPSNASKASDAKNPDDPMGLHDRTTASGEPLEGPLPNENSVPPLNPLVPPAESAASSRLSEPSEGSVHPAQPLSASTDAPSVASADEAADSTSIESLNTEASGEALVRPKDSDSAESTADPAESGPVEETVPAQDSRDAFTRAVEKTAASEKGSRKAKTGPRSGAKAASQTRPTITAKSKSSAKHSALSSESASAKKSGTSSRTVKFTVGEPVARPAEKKAKLRRGRPSLATVFAIASVDAVDGVTLKPAVRPAVPDTASDQDSSTKTPNRAESEAPVREAAGKAPTEVETPTVVALFSEDEEALIAEELTPGNDDFSKNPSAAPAAESLLSSTDADSNEAEPDNADGEASADAKTRKPPVAERLTGRRARLPQSAPRREPSGESLLSAPTQGTTPFAKIMRKALEEVRKPVVPIAPSDMTEELALERRRVVREAEVEALLTKILEESETHKEAHAKFNALLNELAAPVPIGPSRFAITDPEGFRRSILMSKILLLPDLRSGPSWMRTVALAREKQGLPLRLSEDLTFYLDGTHVPEDEANGMRLDPSGAVVEAIGQPPRRPNPAVTQFLRQGDAPSPHPPSPDGRAPRADGRGSPDCPRGHDGCPAFGSADGCSSRDAVTPSNLPRHRPDRFAAGVRWDHLVRILQICLCLGLLFLGGMIGGRMTARDPGVLHVERMAFVDLGAVARSGFQDVEGFEEAFRDVLDDLSRERRAVLVAKNFLLTGPGPESPDNDVTIEVLAGLVDRLGVPGAKGRLSPTKSLPTEFTSAFTPASTDDANDLRETQGTFQNILDQGRGRNVLHLPYSSRLPPDAARTLYATEHAARASRLKALEAEKSALDASRAAEDLRAALRRAEEDEALRRKASGKP